MNKLELNNLFATYQHLQRSRERLQTSWASKHFLKMSSFRRSNISCSMLFTFDDLMWLCFFGTKFARCPPASRRPWLTFDPKKLLHEYFFVRAHPRFWCSSFLKDYFYDLQTSFCEQQLYLQQNSSANSPFSNDFNTNICKYSWPSFFSVLNDGSQ